MPEKKIARLGLRPIRIGASTVEPNIATMCWTAAMTVQPAGKRSSGRTVPSRFRVQRGKKPPLFDTVPDMTPPPGRPPMRVYDLRASDFGSEEYDLDQGAPLE